MYPPADPWGEPNDPVPPPLPPRSRTPMYGRASVPVPTAPLRDPTAEWPSVEPLPPARRRSTPSVSWQRASRASLRSLSDGWGFTAAGLLVAFCGWGLWAAAGRGTGLSPLPGLVFMLAVGAGVFILSRFLGLLVVERMLGRPRLHARWSHFLTFLFLTIAGVAYFLTTSWLADASGWVRDGWGFIGEQWRRL